MKAQPLLLGGMACWLRSVTGFNLMMRISAWSELEPAEEGNLESIRRVKPLVTLINPTNQTRLHSAD